MAPKTAATASPSSTTATTTTNTKPSKKRPEPDARQIIAQLPDLVSSIFDQAQTSLANHKKNSVALYKLFTRCSEVVEPGKKNKDAVRYVGERAFQDVVVGMVNRVLAIKRGVGSADRVVRYLGGFVRYMNEKVVEGKEEGDEADRDEETPTTRFVARLLNYLLQGLQAKNKIVRYRCTHFISEMISHLGEIDEDTYTELRDQLIDRLNDKETFVRAHAVIALSKLVGSDEEEDGGEETILQTLLEVVSTDPAPEVRRAALMNVPFMSYTFDAILTRTRDLDPLTRKLVYSGVLQPSRLAHPRQLSIAQREMIVKDGLGDREPGVRVAAGKVVSGWFDVMVADLGRKMIKRDKGEEEEGEGGEGEEQGMKWTGDDGGVMKGLVQLLGLFDVIGPGEAVAVDAVLAVFSTRPDLPDAFRFPDEYWRDLTPESALLARIFIDHCQSTKNETRLEAANLPVVTAFAFYIQDAYNQLLEILQEQETARLLKASEDEDEEMPADEEEDVLEEELAKREVVLGELLRMGIRFDFGDEIGRRKMFSVVKDMLAHPQLPPGLIDKCLDVLKAIMPSERDLIRVIVEIIVELREADAEPEPEVEIPDDQSEMDASQMSSRRDKSAAIRKKSREEMTARERRQADMTDIRCLMLCSAVLERVNGSFEDNSTLEGILSDLIIPSVKRKELAMREKALVSLGLCCLIAKNMALSSFQLFMSQAQNASGTPPELRLQVFRIILDLLIMYPQEFFGRSEEISKRIVDFLLQVLENEESAQAQAVLCTGICKLLLAGIITDSSVLTCLSLLYISPSTMENQELRQCLAYFFPVYAYSSPLNQSRLQEVFMPTFELALRMYEDLEPGQTMVTPQQFGMFMIDWTSHEKAAEIVVDKAQIKPTHANLAVDILVGLYDSDRSVEEQKILCSLLNQLTIESGLDVRSIQKLNILLSNHEDQCPFDNAVTKKVFDKFKNKIMSLYESELKDINPHDYVDEEFRDLYQKIGVDVPGEDDGGSGRKRKTKGRGAAARKYRMDEDDDEEEEDDDDEEDEEEEDEDDAATEKGDEKDEEEEEGNSASALAASPVKARRPSRLPIKIEKESVAPSESETHASDEENVPPSPTRSMTPTRQNGVKRHHTPSAGLESPANRKRTRVKPPPRLNTQVTPTNSDIESPTTPTKAPPPRVPAVAALKGRKPPARQAPTRATRSSNASSGSTGSGASVAPAPAPKASKAKPTRATKATAAAPEPKAKSKAKAAAAKPAAKPKAAPATRGKRGAKKEPSPEVPSEDEEDEVASVLAESDDMGGYSE